jgi:hypothetical protein
VGTEAPVSNVPLTYWHPFDASVPGEARVEKVIEWLSMSDDKRPHMITLYFEDVDTTTHIHGPGSPESIASIKRTDGYLQKLMTGIDNTAVAGSTYVVVVSDHGQGTFLQDKTPFIIEDVANLDDMVVVDHGTSTFLYLREPNPGRAAAVRDAINAGWRHGTAYLRQDTPASWHVPVNSDFADVILQAEAGYKLR